MWSGRPESRASEPRGPARSPPGGRLDDGPAAPEPRAVDSKTSQIILYTARALEETVVGTVSAPREKLGEALLGVLPTTFSIRDGRGAILFSGIARWRREPTGGSYQPVPTPRGRATRTASDRGRLAPHR